MLELIVSDMDGTLLDRNVHVHPQNAKMLMKTYNMGIPFIVSTGRNFTEAKALLDEAGIRCPIIGLNGAILFGRNGEVEYEVALPDETAKNIIKKGTAEGYYLEAMTSKNVYSSSKKARILGMTELIHRQNPDLSREECQQRATQSHEVNAIEYRDDLLDLIDKDHQNILKITVLHVDGQKVLNPLAEELKNEFKNIYTTSSFENNLEISRQGATKGDAVKKYCDDHGYNLENILTVGDNFNDVTMLEMAGYSYAMGNAEPGVKDVAKYETDTNYNAGVAKAIADALKRTQTI